jgi:alpha-tubulin suppressor-like RCC1 family protein
MFSAKKIFQQTKIVQPEIQDIQEFSIQPIDRVFRDEAGQVVSFNVSFNPLLGQHSYQWYRMRNGNIQPLFGGNSNEINLTITQNVQDDPRNKDSYRVQVISGNKSFSSSAASAISRIFTWTSEENPTVHGCGLNGSYQLGMGNQTSKTWLSLTLIPEVLGGGIGFIGYISKVSAGTRHAFALTDSGNLFGWGESKSAVGLGEWGLTAPNPELVVNRWVSVSAGGDHTIAIKSDGSLWGWGLASSGDGRAPVSNSPSLIDEGSWNDVAAGGGVGSGHSLAIKSDGSLWSWGRNNEGQLGLGDNSNRNAPTRVGSSNWQKISAGNKHSLGIRSDGTLWAWGLNDFGQIGNSSALNTNSPTMISAQNWSDVSAGSAHSLAIRSDGTLWAWGIRVGDGTLNRVLSPKQIGSSSWLKISAGSSSSAAIKSDGTLWTWGRNTFGQLSNGFLTFENENSLVNYDVLFPRQVDSGIWSDVSVGEEYMIAIKTDESPRPPQS